MRLHHVRYFSPEILPYFSVRKCKIYPFLGLTRFLTFFYTLLLLCLQDALRELKLLERRFAY